MTHMTQMQRRDRTRNALIESARLSFAEHGYDASSLKQIAEEAGYSRGAFHAQFTSKSDLALEVIRRSTSANSDWLTQIRKAANQGQDAVIGAMTAYLEEVGRDLSDSRLRLELALRATRDDDVMGAYRNRVAGSQIRVQDLLLTVFTGLGCQPPIDLEELACLFLVLLFGRRIMCCLGDPISVNPAIATLLRSLIMNAPKMAANPLEVPSS